MHVPGYVGIEGNEEVDKCIKLAEMSTTLHFSIPYNITNILKPI